MPERLKNRIGQLVKRRLYQKNIITKNVWKSGKGIYG